MAPLAFRGRIFVDAEVDANGLTINDGRISAPDPAPDPIDLEGCIILPGFIDAHAHVTMRASTGEIVDITGLTVTQVEERIAHADGSLYMYGWDESLWERDFFDRRELDALAGDIPVTALRACGHRAMMNTAAWEDWGFPTSGNDLDWERGEVTERWAEELIRRDMDRHRPTLDSMAAAIADLAKLGIVGFLDYGFPWSVAIYAGLQSQGRLLADVRMALQHRREQPWSATWPDDLHDPQGRIIGIKLYTDGSIGSRTAALTGSYRDRDTSGQLNYTDEQMAAVIRAGRAQGVLPHFHTIGDLSLEQISRVISSGSHAPGGLQGWLEHLEIASPRQLERAAAIGLGASTQPNFPWRWGKVGGLYAQALSVADLDRQNNFAAQAQAGLLMAFGSDGMPYGPLTGLQGACEDLRGKMGISIRSALAAYTAGGARRLGLEEGAGTLRPGAPASLVIIDRDVVADPTSLGDAQVVATVWKGRVTWADPAHPVGRQLADT